MTLTGKLFKAYVQELIAKDGFGTDKMIGLPKFYEAYAEAYANDEKKIAELKAKGDSTPHSSLYCEAHNDLENSLWWLVDNGYLRTWLNNNGGKWSRRYFGLTVKGWSVANKYLNA